MPLNAKFIKVIDNIKYNCNICTEEIPNDKVVSLGCNPLKHIFCYDCIFDWYNQLKLKPNISNYGMIRMCPICRENGGYLPLYGNKYVRGIHGTKCNQIIIEHKKCGYIMNLSKHSGDKELFSETIMDENTLKNNSTCNNNGYNKYEGLCKLHKTIKDEHEKKMNDNKDLSIDKELFSGTNMKENNIEQSNLIKKCGIKLKKKNGFCKNKGNSVYGGCCHIHKTFSTITDKQID